jgi:hypothetical protein
MKQELCGEEQGMGAFPASHHPITLKWVFKLKKDEKGVVTKHKTQLVARGFV